MEKTEYILWLHGEPIVVLKTWVDGEKLFSFFYSLSKFEAMGATKEDIEGGIRDFISDRAGRTVLSEDIQNYEIINLEEVNNA